MSTHDDRSGTRPTGPLVVAVDGPSGSGKSTVSREVAQRLGLAYLDTGAMYRALTWWCLQSGVPLDDQDAVARASRELPLEMGTDPARPTVHVGGVDVGTMIRTTRVSEQVSAVATNLDVRAVMRQRQRELIAADPRGTVAEGRDITTVVAPDADVRVLLTASPEVRVAARSYLGYAAVSSVIGVFAFAYDGIYIGATWTREIRNLMIVALALYLATWWLTLPIGNAGLWVAILVFFGARGALQAAWYPKLVRSTFLGTKPATARP